uniref:(northern house mosquito) hypothetical protein n=1 Tax=Culex pipiens TaxID=7175 RepID=A0A8D8BFF5_CULPI
MGPGRSANFGILQAAASAGGVGHFRAFGDGFDLQRNCHPAAQPAALLRTLRVGINGIGAIISARHPAAGGRLHGGTVALQGHAKDHQAGHVPLSDTSGVSTKLLHDTPWRHVSVFCEQSPNYERYLGPMQVWPVD